ncbi:hypothetical protein C3747_865g5 [Trypanosoma cruzi]|uniref:Uncharacterized protein n=1 Tax=Trypanosoma cruzi TaxID=5693 RepID=A0A2V2UHT9_TRYCR|nr:hypothetical protein C3747_865g5 [Trypanosoma cruzi]
MANTVQFNCPQPLRDAGFPVAEASFDVDVALDRPDAGTLFRKLFATAAPTLFRNARTWWSSATACVRRQSDSSCTALQPGKDMLPGSSLRLFSRPPKRAFLPSRATSLDQQSTLQTSLTSTTSSALLSTP